ncbi:hypothetical protein [Peristeroidobacter soli]|uniref:hypothetical protein n=1 Tax=Peristeroidobacter soli TaxID=2497877 RepID=UPI001C37CA73|nr:hypothetical protein [Peristeroidobacter soli]
MKTILWSVRLGLALAVGTVQATAAAASSEETHDHPVQLGLEQGRIAYVITARNWAVYHRTPDAKGECPRGFNDGPREQFSQLFPNDGTKRTLLETQLMREGRQWFPSPEPEPFKFKELAGKVSYGLNLDGQVKDNDFVSPQGEAGIDNQLYRAIGCIAAYREHDGTSKSSRNETLRRYNYNRFIIEISDVDSLIDDDRVTVKSYRGLDPLMTDASGEAFLPGGTQEIDERWGGFARATWTGRIVQGVLHTEPADLTLPAAGSFGTTDNYSLKAYRFRLALTPEHAEGVMAGYVDVEEFIHHVNMTATSLQSYGQLSSPSLYRALRRFADGYPDPTSGEMTAISSALEVEFVRVYLVEPSTPAKQSSRVSRAH